MNVLLILVTLVSSIIAVYSIRKMFRMQDKIEEIDEQIEESLDILDECYSKIDNKSKMEVFSDDMVIRELIKDIQTARDSILLVANKIYVPLVKSDEAGTRKGRD